MSAPFVFPVESWLARLCMAGAPAPTAESLDALHLAQARSIPFENLDVLFGHGADLAPDALADKLIARRRGGYCYELNGLFALGLEALGFRPRPLLARVTWNRPAPGPRTHSLLLVDAGGRPWLADVGFGGPGLQRPIPLEHGREDSQGHARFRLMPHPAFGTMLQTWTTADWSDLYVFDPEETTIAADILAAEHFTATWPQSPFRHRLLAARATARGRLSLLDRDLTEVADGSVRTDTVAAAEIPALLERRFGIALDAALRERVAAHSGHA